MVKKRNLSDAEIGIVKAMLRKGWRNDVIHFHFNKPDRLISSGRITQIKKGVYGASAEEAQPEELEAFLAARQDPDVKSPPAPSPVDVRILRSLFVRETGTWRLAGGETDRTECKAGFRLQPEDRFSKALRAIAGLANNKGGYLLFGVTDATYQADGLADDVFTKSDISLVNRILAGSLDPVPHVTKGLIELGGKQVGVLYVEKHDHGPVIAIKNVGQDVKEGGIYFRYVGETRLIKPGELRQIIAAREQRAIAEFSARMNRVAIGKEATIDLDTGEVAGTSGKFLIDKSLLPSIQFVREGEFDEKKGAPALRLIGDVEPVSEVERERTRIIRENVTPDAVVRNFLRNEKVAEPMQYIHFQAHAQRKWFPVWFYIDQAHSTASEVVEDLRKQVATYPSSRDALVDRLSGKDAAFRQSTGKAEALRGKLARGDIKAPTDVDEDIVFAGAVQALPTAVKPKDLESIRTILLQCLDRAQGADPRSSNRRGAIYRAASRLDELLYSKK
ncbi:helix-turn-helix domain-containing protein [Bradyrhizobium sp. WSM1743]|uniref:AlbA family DNA-binding domain-containing protein n=1 Tax=Bradyrhizobium sp. WSM1743 TaxID=318996 RepID=UPI00040F11CC|nr:ATP-binding protein [Bradyrhizobium sp. WSM1743]